MIGNIVAPTLIGHPQVSKSVFAAGGVILDVVSSWLARTRRASEACYCRWIANFPPRWERGSESVCFIQNHLRADDGYLYLQPERTS